MNLSPQQKSQLLKLYPDLAGFLEQKETNDFIKKMFSSISMVKGDKGDTPVKGKDYWTDTELNSVINYIKDNVVTQDILKKITPIKGRHYFDGKNGDNYILTPNDKKEIASLIKVPVVEKIIEHTEVIKEISSKSISVEMVKDAVSKKELKNILDGMAKVDGRIKLIDQRWKGGGLSKVSHDSTLSGSGTPSNPLTVVNVGGVSQIIAGTNITISPSGGTGAVTINSSGGGGSSYQSPLSGGLTGTNTWTTAPNVIVIDNIPRQKVQTDGTIMWTGTTTTVLTNAPLPTFDIFASA